VPRRNPADRLADVDLRVGCLERRRVTRRQLLLAVAELRVELVDADRLPLERIDEVVDVVLRGREADRREAERGEIGRASCRERV